MTMPSQQAGQEPETLSGIPKPWYEAENEETFWRDHRAEFLAKYEDQFVAVLNGEVLAANSDLADLLGELQTKGIDTHKVWIRFMTTNPSRTLL